MQLTHAKPPTLHYIATTADSHQCPSSAISKEKMAISRTPSTSAALSQNAQSDWAENYMLVLSRNTINTSLNKYQYLQNMGLSAKNLRHTS